MYHGLLLLLLIYTLTHKEPLLIEEVPIRVRTKRKSDMSFLPIALKYMGQPKGLINTRESSARNLYASGEMEVAPVWDQTVPI